MAAQVVVDSVFDLFGIAFREGARRSSECLCVFFRSPGFRGARFLHDDERAHMGQADLHGINGEDFDRAFVETPMFGI